MLQEKKKLQEEYRPLKEKQNPKETKEDREKWELQWQKTQAEHKPKWEAEIKRLKRELHMHTMLIPFDRLDECDEDKDHDAIRNSPETVALVGWKIVFAKAPDGTPA